MDLEDELIRLRGETIGMQAILVGVCSSIADLSDRHRAAVTDAFDFADHAAEVAAFNLAGEAAPLHLQSFAEIVEQLRKAVLG